MIFAFGHSKQVGKDTASNLLAHHLIIENGKDRVARRSFSDPLYLISNLLYGWAGFKHKLHYEKHPQEKEIILPEIGLSPREILIKLGTHAIRDNVYEKTWVDYMFRTRLDSASLIISDLRFPDEFEATKKHGGICIKIVRPSHEPGNDRADQALAHVSDSEWDHVIVNDGTRRELNDKVVAMYEYEAKKRGR
jgi:hypothetical protein